MSHFELLVIQLSILLNNCGFFYSTKIYGKLGFSTTKTKRKGLATCDYNIYV